MILLTSPSPRRKNLLQQIGFRVEEDFVQIDMPINIDFHKNKPKLTLNETTQSIIDISRLKVTRAIEERSALKVLNLSPEETVVVGATTVMYFDDRVLGRPLLASPDLHRAAEFPASIRQAEHEARQMLSELSGQSFLAMTGVVVAQGDNLRNEKCCCVITEAKMKSFSHDEIERYIRTGEPLDKAGGLGIQGRGVALFEKIKGSYSNVVGLPLFEFVELLGDPLFRERVQFRFCEENSQDTLSVTEGVPELKVVSVGDINYDLSFSKFPAGFFTNVRPPGKHIEGKLYRGIGGTASLFALQAREAKFKRCSVLGVIAGDELGKYIEQQLNKEGIQTLLPVDYNRHTSIALMLRDDAVQDTLITLTDADQALSENDVNKARPEIEAADVLFVSGYCLTDDNRRDATLIAMEWASKADRLVILDITVDMNKTFSFADLIKMTQNKVDVLVAEIPTILAWLDEPAHKQNEWPFIRNQIVPQLREHFPVLFLRTSTYSHEIIVSPNRILGPTTLDYSERAIDRRLGYGDEKTACHLYEFLSPRLLLASKSPRRLALLQQIVAENKIEVRTSDIEEPYRDGENPKERVQRLALEKARQVLSKGEFSPSIEIVIGADTEIVIDEKAIGRPNDDEKARYILGTLSGRTHWAITGIALIDTRNRREIVECISTRVKFKTLSEDEIEQYVQSREPIDKAGAYGIQGKGALLIEEIDGSYSNVVGLPLERLSEILDRQFGMPIWDIDKVSNWSHPRHMGGCDEGKL
jgi:septum formation protein